MVTVAPLVPPVVQTSAVVELNVTGLPEAPPVAATVNVPVPPATNVGAEIDRKLIVWPAFATVRICATGVAAL